MPRGNPDKVKPYKWLKGKSANPKGRPPGIQNLTTRIKKIGELDSSNWFDEAKDIVKFLQPLGKRPKTNVDILAATVWKHALVDDDLDAIKFLASIIDPPKLHISVEEDTMRKVAFHKGQISWM